MIVEGLDLPNGMEFRAHPDTNKRPAPTGRRPKTDWTLTGKALYAKPGRWARIAVDQPTPTLARHIAAGNVAAIDPEMIEADAVQVQKDPSLYDIYARVRWLPRGVENPTEQQEDQHQIKLMNGRRAWYDTHQLTWLGQLADQNSRAEKGL